MKELKRPWIAALLALFLGGPGCFYLGWRRGVTATLVWIIPVSFVVAGAVRQNGLDPYAALLTFFLLWVIQAPLAFLAYSSCKRRNAEAAGTAKRPLDASQQLKIVGVLVIGLSAIPLLSMAAIASEFKVNPITLSDALVACVALWGLATGIGLLLLRPWARLSSLVFHGFLCISGALLVALVVGEILAHVMEVWETLLFAPFALVLVTMGVKGLQFFKRNDIRRHFGGI
ncbi:MAG: hypothetical protein ACLP3K_15005 [Candidatus Acidiferrales bacterium]